MTGHRFRTAVLERHLLRAAPLDDWIQSAVVGRWARDVDLEQAISCASPMLLPARQAAIDRHLANPPPWHIAIVAGQMSRAARVELAIRIAATLDTCAATARTGTPGRCALVWRRLARELRAAADQADAVAAEQERQDRRYRWALDLDAAIGEAA